MEGAASVGGFEDRSKLAQQAGCDMVLVCNNEKAAEEVLESTRIENNRVREQRLLHMLAKPNHKQLELKNNPEWLELSQKITHLSKSYAN